MADRATLLRLRQDVARDLTAAAELLSDLTGRRAGLRAGADRVLCGYVAVTAHQVYTALETVFEWICRALEGSLPAGSDSHQALLHDMTRELPGLRPAVLSDATAALLRPLLRFRHFVRHTYAVAWDPALLREVVAAAEAVWPAVERELGAFVEFLDAVAAREP